MQSVQTSNASISTTTTKRLAPPRLKRFGGFPITTSTAIEWASRIYGEELDDCETYLIRVSILNKFWKHGINFLPVGEGGLDWMVVTQYAPFKGYKGMDPSLIPVFEEMEKDGIARQILEEEGVSMSCIQWFTQYRTKTRDFLESLT